VSDAAAIGARIRSLLGDRARSGARDVALLIHSEVIGSGVVDAWVRVARVDASLRGLPSRVAPVAVPRLDAVGLDLWLAAFAWGAVQVWTLVTHEDEAPVREAIALRMRVAEAILASLGLAGEHLRIIGGGEVSRLMLDEAGSAAAPSGRGRADLASTSEPPVAAPMQAALQRLDRALQRPAAVAVAQAATFTGAEGGHSLLDLALGHLLANAVSPS
jgi:hypothetical protein